MIWIPTVYMKRREPRAKDLLSLFPFLRNNLRWSLRGRGLVPIYIYNIYIYEWIGIYIRLTWQKWMAFFFFLSLSVSFETGATRTAQPGHKIRSLIDHMRYGARWDEIGKKRLPRGIRIQPSASASSSSFCRLFKLSKCLSNVEDLDRMFLPIVSNLRRREWTGASTHRALELME